MVRLPNTEDHWQRRYLTLMLLPSAVVVSSLGFTHKLKAMDPQCQCPMGSMVMSAMNTKV